ncbi:MAG: N-6 DNA methylase [Bacillota bacterium]
MLFNGEGDQVSFGFAAGTERKSTGSYYTPRELVEELVGSALVPVVAQRLREAKTPKEAERALLAIKVCDPACGSGHFLLAAARRLGRELARVRTAEDEPSPLEQRLAVREVIGHCIYGVDKNPLAVELCKVALWIESCAPGKPLTFLDHRIKCGDSLVGVLDLKVLKEGIPDAAFQPVAGDEPAVARALRERSRQERSEPVLFFHPAAQFDTAAELGVLKGEYSPLAALPDDTPAQVRQKARLYEKLRGAGTTWWRDNTACHIFTAAFFASLTAAADRANRIPTNGVLFDYLGGREPDARYTAAAWGVAQRHNFFHWPLEFPEVFEQGGFDVVLCNPPWERIKLQEEEFFAPRDPEIAHALNRAARQKLIKRLPATNPALWEEYVAAKHAAEALSKFLRASGRFPLTARGDINTYSVFAELFSQLIAGGGRAGVVLPTGIATDDTNKQFFAELVKSGRLASLYDFENREGIFPAVDSRYKFCLLTLQGAGERKAPARFAFFLTRTEHLRDARRVFTLDRDDFALLNPNTRTCPVFRTREDAELTKKIYRRVPVLVDEGKGENPWGVRFLRMFDMANDSRLFRTAAELERQGYVLVRGRDLGRPDGPCFVRGGEVWLSLYEAKMIWQFDHRFGTYEGVPPETTSTHLPTPREEQYADPDYFVLPRYWVPEQEVEARLEQWSRDGTQLLWRWEQGWLMGFRDVTNATNERTAIFTVMPRVGVGHKLPLLLRPENPDALMLPCLVANLNALIYDFVTRQKMGGTSLSYFILRQLPVLPPDAYTEADRSFIVPRVLELVYTAWDLEPFARDVWQECSPKLRLEILRRWQECAGIPAGQVRPDAATIPPFRWDAERRARIRAELDAYYAKLYGLTRDELRYILDPKDVFGPDFPGESFRVLKEKEERQYGEYRTRRLVLEAWDRLFEKE